LSTSMLAFPAFLVLHTMFVIGTALILSTWTAFFRDVRHLLEVALAIRAKKPVVLVRADEITARFFRSLDGDVVRVAMSAGEAIEMLRGALMPGARSI